MAARRELKADIAARSVVTTRIIDAPREIVFEAWTSAEHLVRWWGPDGFTTTTSAFDMRPGGSWRFVMHGPDGRDYENLITFDEIARPEGIRYRHGGRDDVGPVQFLTSVTFEDVGGKTRITLSALFPTAAERERVVKENGAIEGAAQTVGRLANYVGELATGGENGVGRMLVLTRDFDAPRELVFKCWTDPKHFAAWWGPHMFSAPKCNLDVRPGGRIDVIMRGPAPYGDNPMGGEFREIVRPSRLIFTSTAMMDAQGRPQIENLNTVSLEDVGGKTRMVLVVRVLTATPAVAPALAGMEMGWSQSLEKLEAHIGKLQRSASGRMNMVGAETTAEAAVFTISRALEAPRALVWKAHTDCKHLMHWSGPKGFKMRHCKIDLRPGGIHRYCLTAPDGRDMWGRVVYREIIEPERLAFIQSFSDERGGIARHPMSPSWPLQMLSELTFTEAGGKTTLTVRWTPFEATAEEIAAFSAGKIGMNLGWTGTLEQLAGYLATL